MIVPGGWGEKEKNHLDNCHICYIFITSQTSFKIDFDYL